MELTMPVLAPELALNLFITVVGFIDLSSKDSSFLVRQLKALLADKGVFELFAVVFGESKLRRLDSF